MIVVPARLDVGCCRRRLVLRCADAHGRLAIVVAGPVARGVVADVDLVGELGAASLVVTENVGLSLAC